MSTPALRGWRAATMWEVVLGLTDTWYGDRIFQICDEEKNVVEVLAYRRNMKNRDTLPQEDPS